MRKKSFSFPSANGLHEIHCVMWRPDSGKEVQGVIQISHGMFECIEKYENVAEFFTEEGYVVVGNDHAGHGESVKDIYGYMGDKDGYKFLVKDVRRLFLVTKKLYPDIPYYMLGHSMGSFIAKYYAGIYGKELTGLILSGTTFKSEGVEIGLLLTSITQLTPLHKKEAEFLHNHSINAYKNEFGNENGNWISSDEAFLNELKEYAMAEGKYNEFKFTYAGYRDLFFLIKKTSEQKWFDALPKEMPIYMFSGGRDPVSNGGTGVKILYYKLLQNGCKNVKMVLYPNGKHEMFLEVNRLEVMEDLKMWMLENKKW